MKARLLTASLIVAFSATAHAQQYKSACPNYHYDSPTQWHSNEWHLNEASNPYLWQGPQSQVLDQLRDALKAGKQTLNFDLKPWQKVSLKPSDPPQEQKKYDVPKTILEQPYYFDSNAIYNAMDIAGPGAGEARWYGRNLEPMHNYDPEILISGHHGNLDSSILITNNTVQDLMLWYHLNDQPKLDSSFWKQFPSLKIDTNSYNGLLYNSNADGLLFSGSAIDTILTDGNSIVTNGSGPIFSGSIDIPQTGNYYYKKDGKRYYMQRAPAKGNVDPGMKSHESSPKAKRIGSSDIWLIDEGTAKTK